MLQNICHIKNNSWFMSITVVTFILSLLHTNIYIYVLKKDACFLKTNVMLEKWFDSFIYLFIYLFLHFIGTLAVFQVQFTNLPRGAEVEFVLINEEGRRRALNFVVSGGVYRVFYSLYTATSYCILFMINGEEKLAVSVCGLGMSQTFLIIKNLS